jgi:hypothetical protein
VRAAAGDAIDQRADVSRVIVVSEFRQRAGAAADASWIDGNGAEAAAGQLGSEQAECRR